MFIKQEHNRMLPKKKKKNTQHKKEHLESKSMMQDMTNSIEYLKYKTPP